MKLKSIFAGLVLLLLAVICGMMQSAMGNDIKRDKDGHCLVDLWKEYKSAKAGDQPRTALAVLEKIRDRAEMERLAWDFYDACETIAQTRSSINWKDYSTANEEFTKAVERYDEPIMLYFIGNYGRFAFPEGNPAMDFIEKNRQRLSEARNEAFYASRRGGALSGQLVKYMENDLEFVLWDCFLNGIDLPELEQCVKGRYPAEAYYEIVKAQKHSRIKPELCDELLKIAEKWKGTAMECYARANAAWLEFNILENEKATEKDFVALDGKVKEIKRLMSTFSGSEKQLLSDCLVLDKLSERLHEKGLWVTLSRGKMKVVMRNMASCKLNIYKGGEGKAILSYAVDNPSRSFYVPDTVMVDMPALDDGEYYVKPAGSKDEVGLYSQYSISAAVQHSAAGYSLYAADSRTGKPLDKVMIHSKGFEGELKLSPDGFTPLPDGIFKSMGRANLHLTARTADGHQRKSREVHVYAIGSKLPTYDAEPVEEILLYADRGAYRPGDSLRFKAIVCKGFGDEYNVLSNKKLEVSLHDTDDNVVYSKTLKSGKHGSASGSILIPKGLKNGHFELRVKSSGAVASKYVVVAEYELPTFELAIDEDDRVYVPGDEGIVSGMVKSYSGHPLSGMNLAWTIGVSSPQSGTAQIAPDGSFEIRFPTDSEREWFYDVKLVLTAPTGEVQEYGACVQTVKQLHVSIDLDSSVGAEMERMEWAHWSFSRPPLMIGNNAEFTIDYGAKGLKPKWKLVKVGDLRKAVPEDVNGAKALFEGIVPEDGQLKVDMSALPEGLYALHVHAREDRGDGRTAEGSGFCVFAMIREGSSVMPENMPGFMTVVQDPDCDDYKIHFGCPAGTRWIVVQLSDAACNVVSTRIVPCTKGRTELACKYLPEWGSTVGVKCFYFFDNRECSFGRVLERRFAAESPTPIEFTRWHDSMLPMSSCTYSIRTLPGAECLVSVYDKSVDTINPANWQMLVRQRLSLSFPRIDVRTGIDVGQPSMMVDDCVAEYASGSAPNRHYMRESKSMVMMDSVEEAVPFQLAESKPEFGADVEVREDFAQNLCFEPHLVADAQGNVDFTVNSAGSLSTFNMQILVHSADMRMGFERRQIQVTMPVKLEVLPPAYLYRGDKCRVPVNLSNSSSKQVKGKLTVQVYDTKEYRGAVPVGSWSCDVKVPAEGACSIVPEIELPTDSDHIGLKYVFVAEEGFSDAMFVHFPIYSEYQTFTENHSCIVLPGDDKAALADSLTKCFVNTSAEGARMSERSIMQMLRDCTLKSIRPRTPDIVSLTEALYMYEMSRVVLGKAPECDIDDIRAKIEACRNSDGGYGWFPGMESSALITALVLERYAALRDAGVEIPAQDAAVKYLDKAAFGKSRWLSMEKYLHARAMWPGIALAASPSAKQRKEIGEVLSFSKNHMDGRILDRARRLHTLLMLSQSSEGRQLASSLGMGLAAKAKLEKDAAKDILSLKEYAVEHGRGVWYYPNAVMPFRGMLESEAYAHALLCRLLDMTGDAGAHEIARGIRLWLMIQRETQDWDNEPGFVDAVGAVLAGGSEMEEVMVLTLGKEYRIPYSQIKASGNGMTISRKFYRENPSAREEGMAPGYESIGPGDKIHVGDVVHAVYEIWSKENRSFVKLGAFREAAMRPAEQLSGCVGWRPCPVMRTPSLYLMTGAAYRDVHAERSDYYIDVLPEEKYVLSERMLIQHEGVFTAPSTTVECLYSPHWSAIASASAAFVVK